MMKAQQMTAAPGNLKVYQDQMRQVQNLRNGYADPKSGKWVAGFNEMAIATGRFGVETVKTISATENLTTSIQKQKLTLSQALRSIGTFKNAWREQAALQKATAMQWTGSMSGKNSTDLYVPKNLNGELDNFRTKYGYINQAIGSVAHQTINWGKNTQWAGRQIMVGIGVPLAIAVAGMAKLAYQADQQLTRIAKVYDTKSYSDLKPDDAAIAKQQELQRVRNDAMANGVQLAHQYGAALKDTLGLEADLAATGLRGAELTKTTEQVTRIATLGELDHQTALNMTITLMSTMNSKASDLANQFNYLNSIENATSLSTQDFAEALPRMAGALTGVGVSVEQMGVLMVALKEGGVNAAEGANALKSATTKLLRPTAAAQAAFSGMGITIQDVVARNGGNLFKILTELGDRMKEYPPLQKQQAIAALFGTYQFNRLNVVMSNLADVTSGAVPDGFSQTARAAEIAGQATSKWASTADIELATAANSISGKFKRAIEGIKADLAKMGGPILDVLLPVAQFVGRFIQNLNNLPGFFKKLLIGLSAFGLVMGPLIMAIGLFGNLFGNFVKFFSFLGGLALRFKAMTAEQRANELMARRARSAFDSEASSIAILTQNMQKMIAVMEQQAAAQQRASMIAGGMTPRQVNAATALRNPNGTFESQAQRAQRLAAETANQSARARVNMMGVATAAAGLFIGVQAIKNMADRSGSMLDNFLNIAMLIAAIQMSGLSKGLVNLAKMDWKKAGASIGTAFTGAGKKAKDIAVAVKVAAAAKFTNMLTGLRAATGLMGKMSVLGKSLFGPLGIAIGVGLLLFGLIQAHKKMEDMAKTQRTINNDAEKLADIFGYTFKPGVYLGGEADPNSHNARLIMVQQMKKDLPDLVRWLGKAAQAGDKFDSVYHMAMQESQKSILSGGSAANARLLMQTALQAAGLKDFEIDNLMIKYDSVDIGNPDGLKRSLQNELNHSLSDIKLPELQYRGVPGKGNATTINAMPLDNNGLAAAEKTAKVISGMIQSANGDLRVMSDTMRTVDEATNKLFGHNWDEWFNTLDRGFQDKLKAKGITSIGELQAYLDKHPAAFKTEIGDLDPKAKAQLEAMRKQYEGIIKSILDQMVADGTLNQAQATKIMADNFIHLGDVAGALGANLMSLDDAQAGYTNAMMDATSKGQKLTEEQKLAILNTWRQKAGMDKAKSSTQGFGNAMQTAAAQAQALEDALHFDPATSIITDQQATGFLKSTMQGWMNIVDSGAKRIADAQDQAYLDSLQRKADRSAASYDKMGKNQDKYYDGRKKALDAALKAEDKALANSWDDREKALDAQTKAESDAYDARVKAIQDEIDALDAADNERQKLFDREKTRISRMAELANGQIDFNTALNSGKLDEAAKIYNTSSAKVSQWGQDDEQARMDDASAARKKDLGSKIDAINAEKDARMAALDAYKDMLKEQRQAEEEAQQARDQQRQDDLQAEIDAAKEKLDANKAAAAARNQVTMDRARKDQEINRIGLDQELAAIVAWVPKTQAEAQDRINKLQELYQKYGYTLQDNAGVWSTIIGNGLRDSTAEAAQSLQTDIGWQQMGTFISQQVGVGTGLTMDSIKTFLQTGKFPNTAPSTAQPWADTQAQARMDASMKAMGYVSLGGGKYRKPGQAGIISAYHSGGHAGFSQGDRVGIPRSASLYPSEYTAILQKGEFVVNRKATEKNLEHLKRINSGMEPHDPIPQGAYHKGGLIDATAGVAAGFGAVLSQVQRIAMERAATIIKGGSKAFAGMSAFGSIIPGAAGAAAAGGKTQIDRMFNTVKQAFPDARLNDGYRPGANDMHGQGKAIDLGKMGVPGGLGNSYMAAMNRWIYDNYGKNTYELIYDGLGDDRADLKRGAPMNYGAALQAQHRNHVHWAMQSFHNGGLNELPGLRVGGKVRYDNTLANLHKNETVLTAPLTKAFEANVASGVGNEYNVNIEFNGPVNSEIDVTKAVRKAIDEIENRNGRKRVIN